MKLREYGKIYRILIGLFMLVSIFCMHYDTYAASSDELESGSNITRTVNTENDKVKMGVQCGIDGFALYDYPAQVSITVIYDENFTGSIRMTPIMDSGQTVVAYERDISLTKGEAKTFSFTPSSLGGTGKIKIELINDKNKTVYKETDRITMSSSGSNVLLGILSEDYSGLNYFDGLPIMLEMYDVTVSTLELTTKSFPENSDSLAMLNYLLIDKYDTANLSDEQYEALKDWVKDGGVLLLSLGSNYQNVLHKFSDDFITGTLGDLKKQDLTWEKEELAESSLENVDTISFEFDDGYEMSSFAADKTAYKKEIGTGAVVVLGYDLGMEPFTSYNQKETVVSELLKEAAVPAIMNKLDGMYISSSSHYNGTNIAKISNNSKRPSALLFGIVLICYVILVGPLLYLFLKKVNKREKIWVTIPIVSLVFTGVIFLLGLSYRVRKPVIDTFSVISLGDNFKSEKVFVNLTCPQAKKYEIGLNEKYGKLSYNSDYYTYNMLNISAEEKDYDFMIKDNNKDISLILDNDKAFEETSFSLNSTSDNDVGNINTADLHTYTDGFDGTITNDTDYDLTNVVVAFENSIYQAGDMKKGETITIDKTKLIPVYAYGTFEQLYNKNKNLYSNKELYRNYMVDTYMENNYMDKSEYSKGYIWGQILSYTPDVVTDAKLEQYGKAVIYSTFSSAYEDVSDVYCPDISSLATDVNGNYDVFENMLYDEIIIMKCNLSDYKGFTTLENVSYGDNPNSYGYGDFAKVYAYNNESDDYDEIFVDGKPLTGTDIQKYIIEDTITFKFERNSVQSESYMPRIIVRGDK